MVGDRFSKGSLPFPDRQITGIATASSKSTVDITVTDSSTPNVETATRVFGSHSADHVEDHGDGGPHDSYVWSGCHVFGDDFWNRGCADGTVTFTAGPTILCTAPVVSGEASCTATTAPGGRYGRRDLYRQFGLCDLRGTTR